MKHAPLFLLVGTTLALGNPGDAGPPPERLPEPTYLPQLARATLHERMKRHGGDMKALVSAVTLLQYGDARRIAERIATEPRLAAPVAPSDEELNALLPERFFAMQELLRKRAAAVAAAAKTGDDSALSANFGRLTEVCISCHSAYLRPRP